MIRLINKTKLTTTDDYSRKSLAGGGAKPRRSVSLSLLQSGGVRFSRVARREASARSAVLRGCVLREGACSAGKVRRAGAGVLPRVTWVEKRREPST